MASRPTTESATTRLVDDLAEIGVRVSVRTVRQWGKLGLAPLPVRRHLGRGLGTVSDYPLGAVEQFAVVASVTRRGLPWHLAVVSLVGRGHLPATERAFREGFAKFFAFEDTNDADPLDAAERALCELPTESSFAADMIRSMGVNVRRAKIREPHSGAIVTAEEGVNSVLTYMAMATFGIPSVTADAGMEIAAAMGLLADAPPALRELFGALTAAIYNDLLPFPVLADVAQRAEPEEVQQAVLDLIAVMPEKFSNFPRLPVLIQDAVVAIFGLVSIRLQEVGGVEGFIEHHIADLGPLIDATAPAVADMPSVLVPRELP